MDPLLKKIKSYILFQYYTQYEAHATLMVTSQKKLILSTRRKSDLFSSHGKSL